MCAKCQDAGRVSRSTQPHAPTKRAHVTHTQQRARMQDGRLPPRTRNHSTFRCSPAPMRISSWRMRPRSARMDRDDASGSACLRNTSPESCSSLNVSCASTSPNARRSSMAPQKRQVETASRSSVSDDRMRTTSRDSSSPLISCVWRWWWRWKLGWVTGERLAYSHGAVGHIPLGHASRRSQHRYRQPDAPAAPLPTHRPA